MLVLSIWGIATASLPPVTLVIRFGFLHRGDDRFGPSGHHRSVRSRESLCQGTCPRIFPSLYRRSGDLAIVSISFTPGGGSDIGLSCRSRLDRSSMAKNAGR